MRYHYTAIRMAKIKTTDLIKCLQLYGGTRTLIHYWRECKLVQPFWKSLIVSLKVQHHQPYDPTIPFLFIYPREMEADVHTKTCAQMFTALVFIIAQTWKLKCPSTGD